MAGSYKEPHGHIHHCFRTLLCGQIRYSASFNASDYVQNEMSMTIHIRSAIAKYMSFSFLSLILASDETIAVLRAVIDSRYQLHKVRDNPPERIGAYLTVSRPTSKHSNHSTSPNSFKNSSPIASSVSK
jgi:hypothetical protein